MFEVHGVYANRKGKYTVLAINGPKMNVRYEDGTYADLNMRVQSRIWENILVEQAAQKAKDANRSAKRGSGQNAFFIKAVSIPDPAEFVFPGWQEKVIMGPPEPNEKLKVGARILYYAIESQIFFAVATITGEAFTANPKKYFYTTASPQADFFTVDMDAAALILTHGVQADSVEMESCPHFKTKALVSEAFLEINEDDFELLAEMLTEVSEDEAEEIEDDDEYEEEEDE